MVNRFQRYLAIIQPILPGAIAALISVSVWQLNEWKPLEQLGYNALFQVRNSKILPYPSWDKRIAVIAIDEASLQKYGRFPWTRDRYVQLLNALKSSRPLVIGFDVLFVEPTADDQQFANAISTIGNVVLVRAADEKGLPLEPVPILKSASSGVGHIFHQPELDGISRRATLFAAQQPSLGLAMLQVYNTGKQLLSRSSKQSPPLVLPQSKGSEELERVWLNWPGKTESLPTYSFADVVEGKVPKEAFAGKFVLVGTTAVALDPILTPLNQNPPTNGVYLHAAVIDNLLESRLLQPLQGRVVILLLLILGPAISWLLSRQQKAKGRVVVTLLLSSSWFIVALLSFTFGRLWMPIAAPVGTMLLAGVGLQLREQQEKQQIMSLFGKLLAPETAQLIWQRKQEIFQSGELQAQEMVATVLFMDIRGFTTISENLSPSKLLGWLNQYLEAMTDCIMDHGGVIDKYIGDAIMAVFGIPLAHTTSSEIKQDVLNAIAASLAMHERLQQLNENLKAQGLPLIQFGIGIHTGVVVTGSVGSSRRLNYSVIGDTVNVAARLEAMNKEVKEDNPYHLLVTGETYDYVREHYQAKPIKSIQLRGREQETVICAILGKN